ncbi:uncharacterized protein BO97DRAFT_449988 [Aspergillus homomorphus CBS 101889]|uniref:Uncharacterized protein n=1 Tax=Aspergillus homomorphus (strain CBS 101889) TaxID=1450537 RepID=A0A395I2D2_ASPHC|nr:hypothetical protein BO97DRAFT_449988 [Aspergillus homomorphus CBS 101889]RAL13338.1 hypothetical protein BO97DRAFT_449988 [Aspergillus homomorphus CBS 101889]
MSNDFDPNRPKAEQLAREVSSALDRAGIHHILWGQLAFSVYSGNFPCNHIDFVVPNEDLDRACNNLDSTNLPCVTDNPSCSYWLIPEGSHAERIFHIDALNADEVLIHFDIRIFPMSWALPGYQQIAYRTFTDVIDRKDLILCSDQRLKGRFIYERYPIRMLAPVHYLQSIISRYLGLGSGLEIIRQFHREVITPLNEEGDTSEGFCMESLHFSYNIMLYSILHSLDENEIKATAEGVQSYLNAYEAHLSQMQEVREGLEAVEEADEEDEEPNESEETTSDDEQSDEAKDEEQMEDVNGDETQVDVMDVE